MAENDKMGTEKSDSKATRAFKAVKNGYGKTVSAAKKTYDAAKKVYNGTKKAINAVKSGYRTVKNLIKRAKGDKDLAVKLASGELGSLTPEQIASVYDILKDVNQTRNPHSKEVNALSNLKEFADKYMDAISADKSILTAGNAKQAAEWLKISQDVQDKINHNQVEAKTDRNNNVALMLQGYGLDTKTVTAAEKKEAASQIKEAAAPVVQQEDNIMLRQQREKEAELRNKDEKLYQQYMEGKKVEAANEVSNVKENQTEKQEKKEHEQSTEQKFKKAMYDAYDKDNGTVGTQSVAEMATENAINALRRGTRVEHPQGVSERMEHYCAWHNRETCILGEYAVKNGLISANNHYGSENYNPEAIDKAFTECLTGKEAEKYKEFRKEKLKEKDMQNWPGLEKKEETKTAPENTPNEKKEPEKTTQENSETKKEEKQPPLKTEQKEGDVKTQTPAPKAETKEAEKTQEAKSNQTQTKGTPEIKKEEPGKAGKSEPTPEKKKRKNPIDKTSKKYRDWKAAQLSGRIRPKKKHSRQSGGRQQTNSNQGSMNLAMMMKKRDNSNS